MTWHAIADDLSGAAEVAGVLLGFPTDEPRSIDAHTAHTAQVSPLNAHARLRLAGSFPALAGGAEYATGVDDAGASVVTGDEATADEASADVTTADAANIDVTVVDSHNRSRSAADAAAHMAALVAAHGTLSALFLKFDSLLRGNVGAELAAVGALRPVVFCPAVPDNARTVVGGVLHIHGVPLHSTTLWAAESKPPASTIAGQLGAVTCVPELELVGDAHFFSLPLAQVRSSQLVATMADAANAGAIIVCDAETDDDLRRIADAAVKLECVLAGAAGLAAAARSVTHKEQGDEEREPASSTITGPAETAAAAAAAGVAAATTTDRDTLFVLGTASAALQAQLAELEGAGVPVLRLAPEQLPTARIPSGTVAVVVVAAVSSDLSGGILRGLVALAERDHGGRHLVLSGGETARAVLDALGITTLHPLAQAHPGAVISAGDDGRLIATRPGSYGDRSSLVEILATIRTLSPHHLQSQYPEPHYPQEGTTP